LTIWRNYAQYLDQKIAQLYPEILDYEIQLGVSQNAGLRGILSDSKLIKKEIAARAPQKQLNLIKELVKRNRIGWRGHKTFEWIVIIFIGLSIVIAFLYFWILRHNPVIDKDYFKMATTWDLDTLRQYPLLLANYSGWVLIFFASVMQTLVWIKHQKNADGRTVSKIVNYEKETR
jgi:hypothetical protein